SEPYGWKRGDVASVPQVCGHGYLCVEFFLPLMGFMLAHAYDRRWREGMGVGAFFKRRLLRLHPLVVSGLLIGLVVFFAQGAGCPLWDKSLKAFGPWELTGAIAAGLFLLPFPGTGFLVPFNPCAWTLCYEYVANILYALFVRRLGIIALAILSVVAGLWSASYALHVDLNALFGTSSEILAKAAARAGDTIEIGWSLNVHHAYGACVRLFFPFLFGMFLARTGWKIRIPRLGLPICLAVFLLVLFTPMPFGGKLQNGTFELAALMVAFPLLLLASRGTPVASGKAAAVCAFFAELSYPFYMSHYPFMKIHNWWVRTHSADYSAGTCLVVGVCEYLALALFAWAVMRFWDRPVRRALTQRAQTP
ncbi:MAG: acyltransferase, partial [Kiritimatiellae bacterium]|nr:acyltransferase [Kiritimatiellia bacterium]